MAKDDATFGDATQAVGFGDALSESVPGPQDDFQLTRVASPVKPDHGAVKDLIDAELAGERLGAVPFAPADSSTPPPASPSEPIAPAPPLGMLARQRTRPGLRDYRRALRMPRIALPTPGTVRKPSSGSTGIIVAMILVIAFVVLAIEFLSSLIGSITNAFS